MLKMSVRAFLSSLFGSVLPVAAKSKTVGLRCPACHRVSASKPLGAVALGIDGLYGSRGDSYAKEVGWISSLRLVVCDHCGVMFTERIKDA